MGSSAEQMICDERDTAHLIRQIQSRYHASHRRDLPRLCALARKVESLHGNDPEAPFGLADLLQEIWSGLEDHMLQQERMLFPSMLQNTAGLDAPLAEMRHHHACHAACLAKIARLTRGFTPPEAACPDWWALYAMVFSFVDDLDEHIHLEDEVLFPRYERRQS
jgi:regulator of cell morphogenesis and NO signaling